MIRSYRTVLIGFVAGACSSQPDSKAGSEAPDLGLESATLSGAGVEPAARREDVASVSSKSVDSSAARCIHDGLWALCSVERRLRQAGFVVRPVQGAQVRRAGFNVLPSVYTVGKARLELFIYRDEASLARDMAGIDSILVAPAGGSNSWESTPVLVRSGNLAAVLLTQNQRQAERFALAITAGAPQRGSPR